MDFIPVKTRKFLPPRDNLGRLLDESLPRLQNKDVLVVTSKIVAIGQGRCVPARSMKQKLELIKQEADGIIPGHTHGLTLKDTALIPYAGIDRSNGNGYYVLWPDNPYREARRIWLRLRNKYRLKHPGVIIIDSFCLPLRWGHYGLSIGFYGFHPNHRFDGRRDIFGRKVKSANSNYVDALSALAGVMMGETGEQTPLLIIRGAGWLRFTAKNTAAELAADREQDMYSPLLKLFSLPPAR